ncbi:MAG: aldo/keto reductase [Deltaproteobacteria bacterium]|nr:MAG: aldo/keto reductase [Deltaproteobacteria bacterium]
MEKRRVGNSGLAIHPLALGGNVFGWTADEPTSFRLLDAFVEAGFDLIDTADVYSHWVPGHKGGESETILGKWLKRSGNRQNVIIATKVGKEMSPDRKGLSKSYILRAAEDSLKRLQTDYIDLYQSHADDPETPLEETLEAFGRLIRDGKVRAIGASNYGPERLSQALEASGRSGLPAYQSLQPLYNLYDRAEYESELEPICLERQLGVLCYFPLASGFLTGKYRSEKDLSGRARAELVKKYLDERGYRILGALDRVAEKHRSTPAAVALAWLIARPGITAPIASATTLDQLNALIGATRLTLASSSIEELTLASA